VSGSVAEVVCIATHDPCGQVTLSTKSEKRGKLFCSASSFEKPSKYEKDGSTKASAAVMGGPKKREKKVNDCVEGGKNVVGGLSAPVSFLPSFTYYFYP
jgi:hypothetical protein